MLLSELIPGLEVVAEPGADLSVRVCDLTEDSRTVLPGSLFIARRGGSSDGRAFVPAAVAAGAAAVLVDDPAFVLPPGAKAAGVALLRTGDLPRAMAMLAERFYGDPSAQLDLIGVTGTNGKTTTTYLIHQILNALGARCGLIGTVQIDDGTEVAPADMTTPPALEISRTLARMVDAGCRAAVMEVSSHALEQQRCAALRFDTAVFTNLTGDHLDYHRTMEAYADAKARLFELLPGSGTAIVNQMDPGHVRMLRDCRANALRCAIGRGQPRDGSCAAEIVSSSITHTDVVIRGPWSGSGAGTRVRLPLAGEFNVMNALQAASAVWSIAGGSNGGLGFEDIARALESCTAPPGRLEPVTAPESPFAVFVDYAHSDDALRTALSTLRAAMRAGGEREPSAGRLTCVFGCGGDRDRTKRPRMGRVAAELADRVIVTSDNPRTEDPRSIIDQVLGGVGPDLGTRVVVEADRERAIRAAIREARSGDVVVIAGKGHEDYQILPDPERPGKTLTRHFSDREVSIAALQARGIAVRAQRSLTPVTTEAEPEEVAAWGAPGMEVDEVPDVQ